MPAQPVTNEPDDLSMTDTTMVLIGSNGAERFDSLWTGKFYLPRPGVTNSQPPDGDITLLLE